MSVIGSNILAGASGQAGYNLTNSLRFRSSASANLSRTPASAGNQRTWTWSGWVKRGILGGTQNTLFAVNVGATDTTYFQMAFGTVNADCLLINSYNITSLGMQTAAVFRDPSAWYHIVFALDTTQATASNRMKLYINGVQQTSFLTYINYPALNSTFAINTAAAHNIGSSAASSYFDGYMAEVNFIDGQALTPSSFGETSATTGVWIPKKYTGTYGTNGFYLPFTNTSSTSTLGNDFSGNSNTWTVNNISLTAGSTYDSMTDVPTLTSATAGNYAVMNPLDNGGVTLSNGNLTITGAGSVFKIARSTLGLSTGKWYCEFVITAEGAPSRIDFGLLGFPATLSGSLGDTSNGYTVYESSSSIYKYNNSTSTLLVSSGSLDVNDVQMLAYDADAGKLWFGKNGTWFASGDPVAGTNAAFTGVSGQTYFVAVQAYNTSDVGQINFGQRPFSYTPPSGFVALNTFNLPTPTIGATASTTANKYMNVVTYTGTGSSLSVTGVGFQPDWTWIKGRSGATDHGLYDAVRGVQKQLESNTTTAETTETTGLTAFGSDGFTVGALAQLNTSSATYVGWNWKANGAGSSNTAGSITSTVSANTTSGFSIVTWAGNSTNAATIGHGLGVAPSILITKSRTNASSWVVGIGGISGFGVNDYLVLQTTGAKGTSSTFYQAYGSSTFTVGVSAADEMNKTGNNYVTYCFAPIAGYSAFGSYTGNGSADGPFIYTGFRPKFFMTKITSAAGYDWIITDTSRDTYNVSGLCLEANLNNAESTNGGAFSSQSDILSNGFKIRNSGTGANGSGGTYIYMAFAETPQKFALGR
jgi:hypothetical protein